MTDPTRPTTVGRRLFLRQAVAVAAGICCAAGTLMELAPLDRDRLLAALGLEREQAARILDCEVARQEIERIAATWPAAKSRARRCEDGRRTATDDPPSDSGRLRKGHLVRVDGWFLAATEALILALTAVAHA